LWSMKWLGTLLLSFSLLNAAFEYHYVGTRSDAMADAYVGVAEGIEGVIFNPAGLALLNRTEISAYYNYLYASIGSGLKGLALQAGPLTFLNRKFALSIIRLGADFDGPNGGSYAENTFIITHGFQLTDGFYGGLNLNLYYLQNPSNIGNALTYGFDIGLLANVYGNWKIGFLIHNLNTPRLNALTGSEDLPAWISAGVSFRGGEYSVTSVEFREMQGYPVRISIGEEVKIFPFARLRAGVMNEGDLFRFTGGAGFYIGKFRLNYAFWYNSDLPLTHTMSLEFIP